MTDYNLEALRKCADDATDAAMRDPDSKNWCVNWGDIACVSAQKFNDDGGHEGYRVVLEEASCYHLSQFVKEYLEQRGFVGVEVITEW